MNAEVIQALSTLLARHADEFAQLLGQHTNGEIEIDVDEIMMDTVPAVVLRRDGKADKGQRLIMVVEDEDMSRYVIRIGCAVEDED